MAQYMLLVYEEEVDAAGQAERDQAVPLFLELHRSLREAGAAGEREGAAVAARARRRSACATATTEIVDGPFAVTKESWPASTSSSAPTSTRRSRSPRGSRPRAGGRSRCARSCRPSEWSETARGLGLELSDEDRRHLA